jgi:hypothetical protein
MAAPTVDVSKASVLKSGVKRTREDASQNYFNIHLRIMDGPLGAVAVRYLQGAGFFSSSLQSLYDLGARALPCEKPSSKLVVNYATVLDEAQASLASEATSMLYKDIDKNEMVNNNGDEAVLRRSKGARNVIFDRKHIHDGSILIKADAIRVAAAADKPYYLVVLDLTTDWDMNTNPKDRAHYRHVAAVTASGSCFEHVKTVVDAGCSLVHLNRSMRDMPEEACVRNAVEMMRDAYFALYDEFGAVFTSVGVPMWGRFWRTKTPAADGWSNDLDARALSVSVDVFAPIFVDSELCLGTLCLQHCSLDE